MKVSIFIGQLDGSLTSWKQEGGRKEERAS